MTVQDASYDRLRATGSADEVAYVQACLRLFFNPTARAVDHGGMPAPAICVADIADIARLNKVAVFMLKALSHGATGATPPELLAWLDGYRRRTMSMNAACIGDSIAIHQVLQDRQIDFVFLKGPLQQQLLYGDHFMKPSGDVDILVCPSGFAAAREALRSAGYEVAGKSRSVWWVRFLGEQHMVRDDGVRAATVDLHYRLQQPGSPSPRDIDGFLRRKREVKVAGASMPLISASDTLLLSCISVAKAFFNREPCAGYVCDVRAAAGRLNEAEQQKLLDHAAEQGLADTLLLALRAADVLLGGTGTLLSDRATRILARIDNADLFHMVIAPWLSSLRWPQRRTVLWELCGREPVRYLAEAGWAASADLSRRIFERPAAAAPVRGNA
ncbi:MULTISPECIES: nucleotidyltransferase family protein [unclassified Mesorhizobium]|uniref:nucleotidyltransferase family protein n=1 Tax=unclassified Mesorhizobium TaxID=325217 RepID=UPI002414D090|nr:MULTISPECIES: nucleotidyltransferase family protein [unclassified Mesorhizobium]MDG4899632.1 nucleotidyltransferase family protein [Mesorhizobium sp. WSM4962]MDG4905562.1 nucleotidyltransferase family protein [Mesorhizobium sp. WSM4898]MDG4918131.1 nucleotidyltransferase family protein [Mesorhizobium sp. WSM4989]